MMPFVAAVLWLNSLNLAVVGPEIDQKCWSRALVARHSSVAPSHSNSIRAAANGSKPKHEAKGTATHVSGDPTMYIEEPDGTIRAATPEEEARLTAELNRRSKVIVEAKRKENAGDRAGAVQLLEPIVSENATDDVSVDASAFLAELYVLNGNLQQAIAVAGPRTAYSNNVRLLRIAAFLNCRTNHVAAGQIDFCKQDVLGDDPPTGFAAALELPNTLQTATFLANLELGQHSERMRPTYFANAWALLPGNPLAALHYGNALRGQHRFAELCKLWITHSRKVRADSVNFSQRSKRDKTEDTHGSCVPDPGLAAMIDRETRTCDWAGKRHLSEPSRK